MLGNFWTARQSDREYLQRRPADRHVIKSTLVDFTRLVGRLDHSANAMIGRTCLAKMNLAGKLLRF